MVAPVQSYEGLYTIDKEGVIFSAYKNRTLRHHHNNSGYMMVSLCKNGRAKKFCVHKLLAVAFLRADHDSIVDHINRDKTDNRLENLRLATRSQNAQNAKTPKTNTSGFKGVTWDRQMGFWRAQIGYAGKHKTIGLFRQLRSAVKARQTKERELFGSFSTLNSILQ